MEFCEKLALLRKQKHMTQGEFAEAVGVTRQAVYKWESGQSYPGALTLIGMKKLFGISIDDLLDPAFVVEGKVEKAPKSAPKAPVSEPVVAPVEETPVVPQAEETPVEESVPEAAVVAEPPVESTKAEEPKKKKGFFARLFGG